MARTRRAVADPDAAEPISAPVVVTKRRGRPPKRAASPADSGDAAAAAEAAPEQPASPAAKKLVRKRSKKDPVPPASTISVPASPPECFRDAAHIHQALAHVVAADPLLASLAAEHGDALAAKLLPQPGVTCFQALAKSIVYQQLAGAAASAIYGRFATLCEAPLLPSKVLAADEAQLRACGLSARKLEYIQSLAQHFEEDTFQDGVLRSLPDDQLCEVLQQVKGVGRWTVEMLMMFSLGRVNLLPTADLGVRKGMQALYKLPQLPTPQQMEAVAAKWHPYRSVGVYLMWQVQTPRASPKKAAPKKVPTAKSPAPRSAPRAKRAAAAASVAALKVPL